MTQRTEDMVEGDNLKAWLADISCNPGSGSFGEAAVLHGRNVTLVDNNPEAVEVMQRRFANYASTFV